MAEIQSTFLSILMVVMLCCQQSGCEDVYCRDIPAVSHGDATMSSASPYKVGTTVKFNCDTGYRGIGEDTIICLKTGEWSNDIPVCTPVSSCRRDLTKLEKGRKCNKRCKGNDQCVGSFETCQCDDWCGKTCFNQNLRCRLLSKPKNGFIKGGGRRYGRTIRYGCNPGYDLIGPSKRRCRSDRKWSGYDSFCVPFSACGFTVKQTVASTRILPGFIPKKGSWPWQVVLIENANYSADQIYKTSSAFGGGSLFEEEWVMTAAHVLYQKFPKQLVTENWKNSFLLAFGMTKNVLNYGLEIPEHIQIFEPAAVFVHPKFHWRSMDYDVALIRIGKKLKQGKGNKFVIDESGLNEKVTFTKYIRPVCLPCMKGGVLNKVDVWRKFDKEKCEQKDKSIFPSFAPAGSDVVITGFQVINPNIIPLPNSLREGRLKVVDALTCAKDVEEIKLQVENARYTERMFCASGGSGLEKIDSCHGDSGSPLVKEVTTLKKNGLVKYWVQLGIVSWGLKCATKHHGYYTSVPSIMTWIWTILDDDNKVTWADWSQWSKCSKTCGGGEKKRTRKCEKPGKCIGDSIEESQCGTGVCPGVWNNWSQWSVCTVTCDSGITWRARSCSGPGDCTGRAFDTKLCSTQSCRGVWSRWSQWTGCSVSCNVGKSRRTRRCSKAGDCAGNAENTRKCTFQSCSRVECNPSRSVKFVNSRCSSIIRRDGPSCSATCIKSSVVHISEAFYENIYYTVKCSGDKQWLMKDLASCICPDRSQFTALKVNVAQDHLIIAGDKVEVKAALDALPSVSMTIQNGQMIVGGINVVITVASTGLVVRSLHAGREMKIGVIMEDEIAVTIEVNSKGSSTVNIGAAKIEVASSISIVSVTSKSNALDNKKMIIEKGHISIGGNVIQVPKATDFWHHIACSKNIPEA